MRSVGVTAPKDLEIGSRRSSVLWKIGPVATKAIWRGHFVTPSAPIDGMGISPD
jgi:hypothetical protein